MAASSENNLFDVLQEQIEILQEKIDSLRDKIRNLKRKRDHLCIIRDEENKREQIRMLNEFNKIECKSINKDKCYRNMGSSRYQHTN